MNLKEKGEIGQLVVAGALAKLGLHIALPTSDNLPYDLIVDSEGELFKVQVKTSGHRPNEGSTSFDLSSNNWYSKTIKKYSKKDCDVVACYDAIDGAIYLLQPKQFEDRKTFTIRKEPPKNGQKLGLNLHEDYVLNAERVKETFGVE
jgi:hypothetical protein